jgi:hypothetical protein
MADDLMQGGGTVPVTSTAWARTDEYISCMRLKSAVYFKLHLDRARDKVELPRDKNGLHRDKDTDKSFIRVKTPDKYLSYAVKVVFPSLVALLMSVSGMLYSIVNGKLSI